MSHSETNSSLGAGWVYIDQLDNHMTEVRAYPRLPHACVR